jgi:hypothetical protein
MAVIVSRAKTSMLLGGDQSCKDARDPSGDRVPRETVSYYDRTVAVKVRG